MTISPVTAWVELDCSAAVHVVVDEPPPPTVDGIPDPIMPVYAVIQEDGLAINHRWTTLAFLAAIAEAQ